VDKGELEMIIKSPILITGAARSGTSMTAGIVNICGAFGGELAGPTGNNKKGMFENTEIRNNLVKPYLTSMGCDPMGQDPLPNKEQRFNFDCQVSSELREAALTILIDQGLEDRKQWFYKGAKMCLIWPLWKAAFPDATWIIVRRDAEDIVRSCLKTGFMRAHKTRSGWLHWVAEHEKRFEEMTTAKLKVFEMWPQRLINGDFTQAQMLVNTLGLKWKEDKVREFIEPGLWHYHKGNRHGQ